MDDGSTIRWLLLLTLLMICNGLFSATETSFASINRIRIMSHADDGDKRAKRVLYILNNFDRALTTLLICNNITHIGSASLATFVVTRLWGTDAVTYSTIVMTVIIFLFGEMIPKYYAKSFSEDFAMAAAGPMMFMMKVMQPLAFVFTKITDMFSRRFKKEVEDPTVTEAELHELVETIAQEGVLEEGEAELVQSALEFGERTASDILLPWDQVLTVSSAMTEAEILEVINSNTHSRLPVLDINGNVMGVLQIRRYLKAVIQSGDEPVQLRAVMDDVSFVRHDDSIDGLLETMSSNRTHISVVLDDEGTNLGILTMEDILEELVGEIYDEDDVVPEGGGKK